jgi:norsolorinic acid ketoreductase
LLSRPNTTVVGTVRHQSTDIKPLEALPKADGSVLIITHLSISTTSTSEIETAHKSLADQLKANHITKINVLIANAGVGSSFQTTATTPLSSVVTDFYANTLGPIALYQSLQPSLKAAENAKYIIIGSILGSIGAMAPGAPSLGYGVSKAGVHYVAKKIHHEEGSLVCVAVHPG